MNPRNPIARIIRQATAVASEHVHIIERIMREEVFHSTLDWQSAADLRTAARKAYAMFEANREFHIGWDTYLALTYRIFTAEAQLQQAWRRSDTQRIAALENTLRDLRANQHVLGQRFSFHA